MASFFASCCHTTPPPSPQDHLLLPASPLLLQHLIAGLCSASEAAGAAAPDHLGHPPAGDLPQAAVGEPAAARAPGQPVSKHTRCLSKTRGLHRLSAVEQIYRPVMVIGWWGSSLYHSRDGLTVQAKSHQPFWTISLLHLSLSCLLSR